MKKINKILIIAEIGVNHNGHILNAKKLIRKAVEAKADIVKFQIFDVKNLVTPYAKKAKYQQKKNSKQSQFNMLKKLQFNQKEFLNLSKFCNSLKIEFCASFFDVGSLSLIKKLKIKRIKIPSGEITNFILLKKIAKLKKKIIMSTGMSSIKEINDAITTLNTYGTKLKDITLLHCNSEYPSPYRDVNLLAMEKLGRKFKTSFGYSDHTKGIEVSIAAAAMGAKVIEKHLTLNKNSKGPDHIASIEPDEFKKLVNSVRNIEISLGSDKKKITNSEKKNRIAARKSIVASQDILKGEKFSFKNISVKRPGNGLSPFLIPKIIGKKASKKFKINEIIKL